MCENVQGRNESLVLPSCQRLRRAAGERVCARAVRPHEKLVAVGARLDHGAVGVDDLAPAARMQHNLPRARVSYRIQCRRASRGTFVPSGRTS